LEAAKKVAKVAKTCPTDDLTKLSFVWVCYAVSDNQLCGAKCA